MKRWLVIYAILLVVAMLAAHILGIRICYGFPPWSYQLCGPVG